MSASSSVDPVAITARISLLPEHITASRRRFPEWWLIVLVGASWLTLLVQHWTGSEHSHVDVPPVVGLPPHHVHAPASLASSQAGTGLERSGLVPFLVDWSVMSVAMMTPVAIPAFRHVAWNSFRARQLRSTTIFLASFVAVWVAFGATAALLVWLIDRFVPGSYAPYNLSIALMLAAGWQVTPWKRRALNACRLTVPLRPFGLRADISCARFGYLHGWRCIRSCWALMAAMAIAGHASLVVMVGVSALVLAEDTVQSRRRFMRLSAISLVLAALVVMIV